MDPVSKIVSDRERSRARWMPWFALAAVLHGSVVATFILFGRMASARPAQLPVVSVKLVQPRPQPPQRRSRNRPRATSVPAPTPPPTAAPTAVPKTLPTKPPDPPASENAMAAPDAEAPQSPTPIPPQAAGSGGAGGLSLGDGSQTAAAGIPADFHFTYYIERMLALIESRWYKPAVPPNTRARLRFRIRRNGRVDGIALEESSGHPSFDRAALRALYAANPLPPLPPAYGNESLTVHLSFAE